MTVYKLYLKLQSLGNTISLKPAAEVWMKIYRLAEEAINGKTSDRIAFMNWPKNILVKKEALSIINLKYARLAR